MKRFIWFIPILLLAGCAQEPQQMTKTDHQIESPGGATSLTAFLNSEGALQYTLSFQGNNIIDTSTIAQFAFRDQQPMGQGYRLLSVQDDEFKETWEPLWGEDAEVVNHYRELAMQLEETEAPNRQLTVRFRLYDDGLGFRYEFAPQEDLDTVVIMDETTEFALTGDHTTWWIPGDWEIYEHLYKQTPFSKINAPQYRNNDALAQSYIPENAVNTPVTMRTAEGLHLSFHEANLTNYAGMTLKVNAEEMRWESELVGGRGNVKAFIPLPFNTPWRTVQVGNRAGDLIESKLIVNLNEPNKLGNPDWIRPMKYVGIWWEMHIEKSSWDLAAGKHGATTENTKRYIDFAAANGFDGVLIEGWNTGWERWIGFPDHEGIFDFVTPYEDYDLEEVVRYAKENGVAIIMHHETSAAPRTYEKQLDTAYALMENLGIHAVKTGYVGPLIPEGEYHHGQWMVNHYRKVLETAAEHQVMVNAHEPIKATGLRRTYPNMIAREGLRGQEFNAWGKPNNGPDHTLIVPFTRMLAGPIDYTPGIFNIQLEDYPNFGPIPSTLARELAHYILLYSPLQMAADLPEHYEGEPAFQFIRDVALDWETSRVLNGEIGDYLTIVRKEKNGDRWFLGAGADEQGRDISVPLDFLDPDKTYRATMYWDAANAHYDTNPLAIDILQRQVTADSTLELTMVPGGGGAIIFNPEN